MMTVQFKQTIRGTNQATSTAMARAELTGATVDTMMLPPSPSTPKHSTIPQILHRYPLVSAVLRFRLASGPSVSTTQAGTTTAQTTSRIAIGTRDARSTSGANISAEYDRGVSHPRSANPWSANDTSTAVETTQSSKPNPQDRNSPRSGPP